MTASDASNKKMPLRCPTCGSGETGRYDFGPINVDGAREIGHTQFPCGFNYELKVVEFAGKDSEQVEIVHRECQRLSK